MLNRILQNVNDRTGKMFQGFREFTLAGEPGWDPSTHFTELTALSLTPAPGNPTPFLASTSISLVHLPTQQINTIRSKNNNDNNKKNPLKS